MTRGKWEGKICCPACGRMISKRGFAWSKHEATHPELLLQKRKMQFIFSTACRIAQIKE